MGAVIQNGNIGAIIQNGIVYGGTIIESGADISFNKTGTVYFKPGETDQGHGDYIAISTDGETWTEYNYQNIYVWTDIGFCQLRYNSPYYYIRSNTAKDELCLYDSGFYSKEIEIVSFHWNSIQTGSIDKYVII